MFKWFVIRALNTDDVIKSNLCEQIVEESSHIPQYERTNMLSPSSAFVPGPRPYHLKKKKKILVVLIM